MEFTPFDPAQATDDDFRRIYALAAARHAVDWPELTATKYEAMVARLRTAGSGSDPETLWLAEQDGELVASALYEIGLQENTHLATITISVHPEWRRKGIGTEFLRVLLAEARAAGRTRVMGAHVRTGSGAEHWAARVGLGPGQICVLQELVVADVDPALWDVPAPEGYRLLGWTGTAPDDIVASYARARGAIHDAVIGDLSWRSPEWTADRVRQEEAEMAAAGVEQRVVAAVHEASGEAVGLTQVAIRLAQSTQAGQRDTAVLRDHRGHGLGRALKAAMMRRLVAERPGLERIGTQTGDIANMARINTELGYREQARFAYVEADIAEVEQRIG